MKKGVGSGVRGTDPGIRIRTKMSWIPNTVCPYPISKQKQVKKVKAILLENVSKDFLDGALAGKMHSDPDPDPALDPAIFVLDLQDANQKLCILTFPAYYLLKLHLHNFSMIKIKS
jgi:hypothetical protein